MSSIRRLWTAARNEGAPAPQRDLAGGGSAIRRYTERELHEKVRGAGLRVVRSTSFVSLLLPAMLASRRRGKLGTPFNPADELRIAPVVNRALDVVLRAEIGMIRMGVSFPAGGSRLVVAVKPAA